MPFFSRAEPASRRAVEESLLNPSAFIPIMLGVGALAPTQTQPPAKCHSERSDVTPFPLAGEGRVTSRSRGISPRSLASAFSSVVVIPTAGSGPRCPAQ